MNATKQVVGPFSAAPADCTIHPIVVLTVDERVDFWLFDWCWTSDVIMQKIFDSQSH